MSIRVSFVIGNGESRGEIELETCKKLGLTVGCNAIVRDFHPHIVSAADQRMVEHVQQSNFTGKIFTRPDWNVKYFVDSFPDLPYQGDQREDNPWHWNSGPHAINIACQSRYSGWFGKPTNLCFLLGFDLKQSDECNNIYKNTDGYDDKVIDPRYWHYQLNKIFENYKKITFVWVAPENYTCADEWLSQENFFRETIDNFKKFIADYTIDTHLVSKFA